MILDRSDLNDCSLTVARELDGIIQQIAEYLAHQERIALERRQLGNAPFDRPVNGFLSNLDRKPLTGRSNGNWATRHSIDRSTVSCLSSSITGATMELNSVNRNVSSDRKSVV